MPFLIQKNNVRYRTGKEKGMTGKVVKVKVVKAYKDMQKMLLFHEGEEHEVTEQRAKELVKAGVAEVLDDKKNNPPPKAAGIK